MMKHQYPGRIYGLNVIVSPDYPRMQLSSNVDFLKEDFKAEMNAWLRSFFGTHNLIKDGDVINLPGKAILMNPRTYAKLQEALRAEHLGDIKL